MRFIRLVLLFGSFVPSATFAAANTFQELAIQVVSLMDVATFTLITFGLLWYFWGMIKSIPHFGDEKGAERRTGFFWWGIIVIFVMVSIWGIIQLLQNTLFDSTADQLNSSSGSLPYE